MHEFSNGICCTDLNIGIAQDFFVFILSCAAAILDTTNMKVFDCDIKLQLAKLDELPNMAALKPTKVLRHCTLLSQNVPCISFESVGL